MADMPRVPIFGSVNPKTGTEVTPALLTDYRKSNLNLVRVPVLGMFVVMGVMVVVVMIMVVIIGLFDSKTA
jgi:uncharacterized membrane protein